MEQPPPLTPQEITGRQAAQTHDIGQPQTVKIFGIMHLVFGAFGILMSVWSLFVLTLGNPVDAFLPKTPEMARQQQMQAEMQSDMLPSTIVSTVFYIAVTALIIFAGIKLLKKRKDGLKWSNRYAVSSLITKAIALVFMVAFTIPAMNEMNSELFSGSSVPMDMGLIMAVSMVATMLITCVYPILTLIFLNRPKTREWFAALPG